MLDLSTLNPPQRLAVEHRDGPLLVLAGAGSGKTRVVTYRIAHLISHGAAPGSIVGLTFTNKAAAEMRERVGKLVPAKSAKQVVLATFHSLCCRILRRDIEPLGYGCDFSIFSESDQMSLLRSVLPKSEAKMLKLDARALQTSISDAKNRHVLHHQWKSENPIQEFTGDVYRRYQEALRAQNAVDFDDLISLVLALFKQNPEVLEKYRERWRYFLVDEYQDTNDAQHQLIQALAGERKNVCAVGDDDQSIYAWRGARPEHILDFAKHFTGARIVKLEQNYRSTPQILGASNALIVHNKKRHGKSLWTDRPEGTPVTLFQAADGEEEAKMIISSVQRHHFEGKRPWRDFAVLYRTNVQSRPFEEECRMHRIPYVVMGGQQYFDRKEVKDILAYLKVIANPHDAVSLRRIINTPRRGIGDAALARFNEYAREINTSLWETIARSEAIEGVPAKTAEAGRGFIALISRYRELFRKNHGMSGLVLELIRETDYWQACVEATKDVKGAQSKLENAEEVAGAMAHYERESEKPTLVDFLDKMTLVEDREDEDPKDGMGADAVRLMTLHSAKGLEFPFVYLTGLEDEILPHARSCGSTDDLAEERRLLYVGMTRAQKQLVMTYAARRKHHGKDRAQQPSRFIKELPDDQIRRIER